MNTKEYLSQLKNIDRRIKDKVVDSQRWLEIAIAKSTGTSGGSDDVRVQSTPNPDRIFDAIVKSADYGREAEQEAERLTDLMHKITKQIDAIDDETYYNVLRGYYVDDKPLRVVAYEIGYSYNGMKKKLDGAEMEFESRYGAEYLN